MIDRIMNLLNERRLTAKSMCESLGFSASTVTEWRRGRSSPTVKQIIAMAQFFDVTTDFILLGREDVRLAIDGNGNIVGDNNSHNTVTINGDPTRPLTEIEAELLRICGGLETREKNELLTYAYRLENKGV